MGYANIIYLTCFFLSRLGSNNVYLVCLTELRFNKISEYLLSGPVCRNFFMHLVGKQLVGLFRRVFLFTNKLPRQVIRDGNWPYFVLGKLLNLICSFCFLFRTNSV
uniref:Uncharacterized protein n=1 Tax=Cacopsylla melanoneura TaxID=428564 RepID=A0A8D9AGI7_9HEMI